MSERTGIIYQAKCLVTGKSYIGQTVQGLKDRKRQHSYDLHKKSCYFHRAILKHGWDSFV